EPIAFFTVLSEQGLCILHGRRFHRKKAVTDESIADDAEDVFSPRHLRRGKIARAFGDRRSHVRRESTGVAIPIGSGRTSKSDRGRFSTFNGSPSIGTKLRYLRCSRA